VLTIARPRFQSAPEFSSSLAREAIELSASAGLVLDPHQELVLEASLGVRDDGKWAAFEVAVNEPRQNGKGGILEARELTGLFLVEERFQIHSAHQFDTSLEAFRRLLGLIEETPDLERQVKKVRNAHGEEGIELLNGCRIRFRTRTRGGGRGFSCDTLYLDEAMFLPEFAHGALMPTLSARPNPQVWYTGSAVDREVHENGIVFARIRKRGIAGGDPSLAYFEWSVDADSPREVTEEMAGDESLWFEANPALGIRISAEHIAHEHRSMDPRTFAVERLGVGDWPPTDGLGEFVVAPEDWAAIEDPLDVQVSGEVLAFDVNPDRRTSIASAGRRSDGRIHIDVLEIRAGTLWLPAVLLELAEERGLTAVVCDGYGPAASLITQVEETGLKVEKFGAGSVAQACGRFIDGVDERTITQSGSGELRTALSSAAVRPLGDSWAWSRKNSSYDISPLVAATLALSAAMDEPEGGEMVIW
jgi:hypothetical protein